MNTKERVDLNELPAWRIDNLYTFIISIVTMAVTIAGFYFAMVNRLTLIEERQGIANVKLAEISDLLKDRAGYSEETRARVIMIESKIEALFNLN